MAPVHEAGDSAPSFPSIFDKERLKSGEFDRYIYEIPFKVKGGGVRKARGMAVAGYVRAVHPYLKSIHSELVQYGFVEGRKVLSCVVRVVVTIVTKPGQGDNTIVVEALADGDVTGVPSADTLVRTVETRALNRALGRVLDISNADLNTTGEPDEEEPGTPVYRPSTLTEKMNARKDKEDAERKRIAEEEGEDDNQTDEGRISDIAKDNAATPSEDTEDW